MVFLVQLRLSVRSSALELFPPNQRFTAVLLKPRACSSQVLMMLYVDLMAEMEFTADAFPWVRRTITMPLDVYDRTKSLAPSNNRRKICLHQHIVSGQLWKAFMMWNLGEVNGGILSYSGKIRHTLPSDASMPRLLVGEGVVTLEAESKARQGCKYATFIAI